MVQDSWCYLYAKIKPRNIGMDPRAQEASAVKERGWANIVRKPMPEPFGCLVPQLADFIRESGPEL